MIRIDRQSLVAEIEADERLDRIEAACLAQGTTLGPVSDIDASATLLAALTQRSGRRSPRYGELWDRILSLEAEFPGGKHLVTKGAPRAATGPDIARTVLEARGQLGRITKVQARLKAAPRERTLLRATAVDLPHALAAVRNVLHAGALAAEISLAREAGGAPAHLAMRFEGDPVLVAADTLLAKRALAATEGVVVDEDPAFSPIDGALVPVAATDASKAARVVSALWSALPAALTAADAGRVIAIAHEGATLLVEDVGARTVVGGEAIGPLARDYLGRIADALARRCA